MKSDNNPTPTTVIGSSPSYTALAVGSQIFLPIPQGINSRYLMLTYTLGGTSPTVTLSSTMTTHDGINNIAVYPSGFTVS
jgi:hypothetical protein